MKNPIRSSSKQGFTLVELLVVIAIIAVLAAAGFGAGSAAIQKARQVSAQSAATSIVTAVDQFYTEYSALPDPTGATEDVDILSDEADGASLLEILMGKEDPADQNDRSINFLSLAEAKGGATSYKNGVYYADGATTPSGLRDPWGEPYTVVLDLDYDDVVEVNPGGSNSAKTLNSRKVAVFSLGTQDEADATPKTLVKTW